MSGHLSEWRTPEWTRLVGQGGGGPLSKMDREQLLNNLQENRYSYKELQQMCMKMDKSRPPCNSKVAILRENLINYLSMNEPEPEPGDIVRADDPTKIQEIPSAATTPRDIRPVPAGREYDRHEPEPEQEDIVKGRRKGKEDDPTYHQSVGPSSRTGPHLSTRSGARNWITPTVLEAVERMKSTLAGATYVNYDSAAYLREKHKDFSKCNNKFRTPYSNILCTWIHSGEPPRINIKNNDDGVSLAAYMDTYSGDTFDGRPEGRIRYFKDLANSKINSWGDRTI